MESFWRYFDVMLILWWFVYLYTEKYYSTAKKNDYSIYFLLTFNSPITSGTLGLLISVIIHWFRFREIKHFMRCPSCNILISAFCGTARLLALVNHKEALENALDEKNRSVTISVEWIRRSRAMHANMHDVRTNLRVALRTSRHKPVTILKAGRGIRQKEKRTGEGKNDMVHAWMQIA